MPHQERRVSMAAATSNTTAEVEVFRWVARGFTDDVTDCQHCGKTDLKGTVRMVALGPDNEDLGDCYMGVGCAARMSGRKAAEIRTEASRADRQARDAARPARVGLAGGPARRLFPP